MTSQPDSIDALVIDLGSKDGQVRQQARHELVAMSTAAIDALTGTLSGANKQTRWEAAKALAGIGAPQVAPGLVTALADEESDIRWIAAEGLIALDRGGLELLLDALARDAENAGLRKGAHHVLKQLVAGHPEELQPVLQALESPAAVEETLVAAASALAKLEGR